MDRLCTGKQSKSLTNGAHIFIDSSVCPRIHSWPGRRSHLRHGLCQSSSGWGKRTPGCRNLPHGPVYTILAVFALPGNCTRSTSLLQTLSSFIPIALTYVSFMRSQIACGVIFGIIMGCPAHWFKRKLGLALGIMALGSSIGGTLYPIIVKNLMQKVGYVDLDRWQTDVAADALSRVASNGRCEFSGSSRLLY